MTRATVGSWIRSVLRRSTVEQDLDEELHFHIDRYAEDLARNGVDRREALRRARAEFGAVAARKDECRDALGLRLFDEVRQDLRFAGRQLRRTPGFTLVVVATLALGIGVNTAIFSVVHALLLKPLPYATDSDRLVRVIDTVPASESYTRAPLRFPVSLSAEEVRELQSQSRGLSVVGVVGPLTLRLTAGGQDTRLQAARVSSETLRMLGAHTLRGRIFSSGDDHPSADAVALVSFSAWQQQFRGNPEIVGRTITLATTFLRPIENRFVVVGVMPPEFAFPDIQTKLWIPSQTLRQAPFADPTGTPNRVPMLAKLADGVSLQAAAAEVEPLVRQLRNVKASNDLQLVREQDEVIAPVKPALLVLIGAVGFVLLIACANVANLLLARTAARQREIAIRAGIGASRARLLRQALTESVFLALLGGGVAIAFAVGCVQLLRNLATTLPRADLANGLAFPRLNEIALDVPVLMFTLAISVVTGIAFGIGPALRYAGQNPSDALRDSAGTDAPGVTIAPRLRSRSALVVAEIAIAMVLLVGAGLLVRSFVTLSNVHTGYNPSSVLTFQVDLPLGQYPDARLRAFADELVDRLRSIPGVEAAASANQLPMVNMRDTGGGLWKTPSTDRANTPVGDCRVVSHDYLKVMGIHLIAGRGFAESDTAGQPRVLLINQTLSRQQFPNENPIGRSVFIGRDPAPWQIVGVVDDVRQFGLDRDPDPQFFVDQRQWSPVALRLFPIGTYFAVRTSGPANQIGASLDSIARQLDTRAVVFNVASMEQIVSTTVAKPRMYAVLLGMFAAVGATLAVIGIFGVIAYSVARRTREFGIQMALGAQRGVVLRRVLGQGCALACIGIVLGLAMSALTTRYLQSLLFEVEPLDIATFAELGALFAVVALVASYLPARRATRINPSLALRTE